MKISNSLNASKKSIQVQIKQPANAGMFQIALNFLKTMLRMNIIANG
jgi:hypothetical protein